MSYSAAIFIDSANSLEALANDVSRMLEVDLQATNSTDAKCMNIITQTSFSGFTLITAL